MKATIRLVQHRAAISATAELLSVELTANIAEYNRQLAAAAANYLMAATRDDTVETDHQCNTACLYRALQTTGITYLVDARVTVVGLGVYPISRKLARIYSNHHILMAMFFICYAVSRILEYSRVAIVL